MRTRTTVAILGAVTVLAACSPSTESPGAGPIRGPEPSVATPIVASVIARTDTGSRHRRQDPPRLRGGSHQRAVPGRHPHIADGPRPRRRPAEPRRGPDSTTGRGSSELHTPTAKIGPAQTATVWLDVALDKDAGVPTALTHNVGVSLGATDPTPVTRHHDGERRARHCADSQARGDLAAVGWTEMVGRRQLLRHDRTPDGAEFDQRPAVGC